MGKFDAQAVQRIGPARNGDTTKVNRAFRTAAAVDGSAGTNGTTIVIPGTGPQLPGCWVTFTNIGTASTDLLAINFQRSSENGGTPVAASSASDFVIPPGTSQDFWLDSGVDQFRLAGPVTAIASWYRSSL